MALEIAGQALDWLKWGLDKINIGMIWLSEIIANKFSLELQNVHLILLLGISLYIASKVTNDRGLKLLFLAAIIFAVFFSLGGGI